MSVAIALTHPSICTGKGWVTNNFLGFVVIIVYFYSQFLACVVSIRNKILDSSCIYFLSFTTWNILMTNTVLHKHSE